MFTVRIGEEEVRLRPYHVIVEVHDGPDGPSVLQRGGSSAFGAYKGGRMEEEEGQGNEL